MIDLMHNIKHLGNDVKQIHDRLEHLSSHSKICNDLVRESNYREANELFNHLQEIDNLIHGVQSHVGHIKKHIHQTYSKELEVKPLDIDDLKDDAKHTSFDLKDIHIHIEHLISHTEMCRDIVSPNAEEELIEIKGHLKDIDEIAHELLDHINEIRGGISTKFSEFIWEVPAGFDEFLVPSRLIDNDHKMIKDMALRLVDGVESLEEAVINILCFVRDFIEPKAVDEHTEATASKVLITYCGSGISKSILACALARAVSIPSQIHFARVSINDWLSIPNLELLELPAPEKPFSISWPEFFINNNWEPGFEVLKCGSDTSDLFEKFKELGIKRVGQDRDPMKWQRLPVNDFEDNGTYSKPIEYLTTLNFSAPLCEVEKRLFAGIFYNG